jgi:UDP-glucose:(heptosyl)LPS alpha-1,3-glucosyltransferase
VKRSIAPYYELSEDRLATLFNAVDLERFRPDERRAHDDGSPMRALMIANDFERKGLAQTLAAVAKLADSAIHLDVVGKEDAGRYESLAADLKISDRVTFHGAAGDPRPHYAAADFFVLPTRHDPCSLVVLEALSCGLPVISTAFNGACEIMFDGVHGFVLSDPDDVDALASAMRQLLDPARRAAMSRACVDLRPRLSYEHHLDRLLEIYQGVKR